MKHYTVLWDHYTQQKWARQRFALYSGKKSVYDKFFTRIKRGGQGRRTIIAYGDAGFASTARNELSATTSRSLKE
ncbi:MAG: hypothetical protein EHM20_18465, partial [Alphaproteobacteria bacterium]